MRALLLGLAASLALAPAAHAASLRIASIGTATGPCASLGGDASAGERAYFEHLHRRLGREVLKCPFVSRADAAAALGAGQADMAVLDAAAFAAVQDKARAILTVRPQGALNRIPVLVVTRAAGAPAALSDLKGRKAVFAGSSPAALATPRRALADQGAGRGFFASETVAADSEAAAQLLRSGGADAMVLHAAAWQRLCRGERAKENRCADLKPVWVGRPRAALAVAVRRDMPPELRFRLIGVHVAMHLEAKDAFAWAAAWTPRAAEFEPTEAQALLVAGR